MEVEKHGRISAVMVLVVVNSLIFIIGSTLPQDWTAWDYVMSPLSRAGLEQGRVWELISYQFLHGSVYHVAFNMLALWFAGRDIESVLGIPKFLGLYFVSGVVGGLVQVFVSAPGQQFVGASAAVCGVMGGFSAMYPEMKVTVLLFFVLPLKARAKWIGISIVVLSLIFILLGRFPGIGHAAHLGGTVAGALIVWIYGWGQPPLVSRWLRPRRPGLSQP